MNVKLAILLLTLFALLLIAGCTAGPNNATDTPNKDGKIAGFWKGLWHGIISPIMFIVSLFNKNVNLYEVHNSGQLYNLGFVIGAGILFGGSKAASCKR